MHIRPIPLGLAILGAGIIIGRPQEEWRWFLRNPVWMMQNWRSTLKGVIVWLIIGAVALTVGIVGLLI